MSDLIEMSPFILFLVLSIIYYLTATKLYIDDKELRDKNQNKYILTIFMQIVLVLLCLLTAIGGYHMIQEKRRTQDALINLTADLLRGYQRGLRKFLL